MWSSKMPVTSTWLLVMEPALPVTSIFLCWKPITLQKAIQNYGWRQKATCNPRDREIRGCPTPRLTPPRPTSLQACLPQRALRWRSGLYLSSPWDVSLQTSLTIHIHTYPEHDGYNERSLYKGFPPPGTSLCAWVKGPPFESQLVGQGFWNIPVGKHIWLLQLTHWHAVS